MRLGPRQWSTIGSINFDNRSMALNDEATLMILDDENVLGRIFAHYHQVEFLHIALNGLKICHPLPLQAAVTITSPVEELRASRRSQAPPVY